MINVKEFSIKNRENIQVLEKAKRKSAPPKISYEVVYENEIDFMVRRKTSRTSMMLVYLISQNSFYILNEKTNEVFDLNNESLKKFGICYRGTYGKVGCIYKEGFFKKVAWIKQNRDILDLKNRKGKLYMFKKGVYDKTCYNLDYYIEVSPKLLEYCIENLGLLKSGDAKVLKDSQFKFMFEVCENVNYNKAIEMIEILKNSRMKPNWYGSDYERIFKIKKEYNLDFDRMIQYIFFDLYTQGISDLSFISTYEDYLRMTMAYNNKIKEKYPMYLATEHDKILLKHNILTDEGKKKLFKNVVANQKELSHKGRVFSIVVPEKSQDLIDEGVQLSHCVGTYIDHVIKGTYKIVFMRKNESIEESVLTVAIDTNNEVSQVEGMCRRKPNKEEKEFIKMWAKKKNLTYK